MKRELRDAWCEALRSGKYQQAEDQLRNGVGYCCLGVACDISGAGEWVDSNVWGYEYDIGETQLETELNEAMLTRLGLNEFAQRELIAMNDDGVPFPVIADWIEQNIPIDEPQEDTTDE